MKKKVVLKRIYHRDRWRIAIMFDYDTKLKEIVRSISGSAFSGTNRCFYVDDSEENLRIILKMLKDDADVDISQIVKYKRGYRPREYMFEEQTGGRYSSGSVYRVVKDALLKAGIKKDVGVHCLRHSYATHLHESGSDIRYIQELLGHKSTRTTEIYTHVSRRNLIQVRSPIEDMDVK